MGIYNCQKCIAKDINFLNEILLDDDLFGKGTMNHNNLTSPSKVSIKASKENLLKALDKENIFPEEKKYYENFINELPNIVINLGYNNIVMNSYESYEQSNEIKKIEEDDFLIEQGEYQGDGQFYFYQMEHNKY